MSATKPPPGYDDRFVVPLEPSRRGAHRARVSPLIGALPVLAVVAVVVVVIVLAWTLFGHTTTSSSSTAGGGLNSPAATQASTPANTPGETVTSPAAQPSKTAPTTQAAAPTKQATVDKKVAITVLNSTGRTGLAGKAASALVGKGWTAAHSSKTPTVTARPTTVYYAATDQKALAEAVVADLGLGVVKKSATIAANGVTVIVGTDYP